MQIQGVFNSPSRLTPAIASLIAHCAVVGILFITGHIVSTRLQEKQIDVSKTFTLISPDFQQILSSSKPESFFKHTALPEPLKPEQPPVTTEKDAVTQTESVECNAEKSNQNPAIDSSLHIIESATGQKESVGNSSGKRETGEKETSGYIDETKITGGLKVVFKPAVPYPQVAQDREIEGDVEVAFIVSTQGTVEDISILRSIPSNL
jgi:outer membrane biosynthesis protein TonB